MSDDSIHRQVDELVAEEHSLRERLARGEISAGEEQQRLAAIEVELDRLWDLLRQRAARRAAGQPEGLARERSAQVVEDFLQ